MADVEEDLRRLEGGLAAAQRVLGADHPDTLAAMNNLAYTLQAQGDLARARELQEEVMHASRRILGPDDPETLRSINNLAVAFRAPGDLIGAMELHQQALDIRQRLLGPEHPAL